MMARKGNQQKNSLGRNASENKFTVSDSVGASLSEKKSKVKPHEGNLGDGKELPNSNHECMPSSPSRDRLNKARSSGDRKKNNQRSAKVSTKDKFSDDIAGLVKPMSVSNNLKDDVGNETVSNATESKGDAEVPFGSNPSSRNFSSTGCTSHKLADEDVMDGPASSDAVASMT